MSLSVCPIAFVQAPAGSVWALLSIPARYAEWREVTTDSIVPAGPAQPGQVITAHGRALGKNRTIRIQVESVDASRRELGLTTWLPFGMTMLNRLTVLPVDERTSRVSFV